MENLLRLPNDFTEFSEDIISNFDGIVNEAVAEKIKGQPIWAPYPGWNFYGYVWWQDGKWHCEVWTYNCYRKSFSTEELADIRTEVSDEYGYE